MQHRKHPTTPTADMQHTLYHKYVKKMQQKLQVTYCCCNSPTESNGLHSEHATEQIRQIQIRRYAKRG